MYHHYMFIVVLLLGAGWSHECPCVVNKVGYTCPQRCHVLKVTNACYCDDVICPLCDTLPPTMPPNTTSPPPLNTTSPPTTVPNITTPTPNVTTIPPPSTPDLTTPSPTTTPPPPTTPDITTPSPSTVPPPTVTTPLTTQPPTTTTPLPPATIQPITQWGWIALGVSCIIGVSLTVLAVYLRLSTIPQSREDDETELLLSP